MTTFIRRLLTTFGPFLLTFALLLSAKPAQAGVPVIDVSNLAQAVEQVKAWAEQYKQMADQISTLKDQYSQMVQQYNDLRANPFGTVLNAVGGALSPQTAASASGQGWNDTSYGKEGTPKFLSKYNPCQPSGSGGAALNISQGAAATACEAMRNMQAGMMNDLNSQLLMVQKHEQAIESLLNKAGSTTSPGEMQSLQIKLLAYNGILQADIAKIQLSMQMYQQRTELYKRQLNESIIGMAKGNGGPVSLSSALGK